MIDARPITEPAPTFSGNRNWEASGGTPTPRRQAPKLINPREGITANPTSPMRHRMTDRGTPHRSTRTGRTSRSTERREDRSETRRSRAHRTSTRRRRPQATTPDTTLRQERLSATLVLSLPTPHSVRCERGRTTEEGQPLSRSPSFCPQAEHRPADPPETTGGGGTTRSSSNTDDEPSRTASPPRSTDSLDRRSDLLPRPDTREPRGSHLGHRSRTRAASHTPGTSHRAWRGSTPVAARSTRRGHQIRSPERTGSRPCSQSKNPILS